MSVNSRIISSRIWWCPLTDKCKHRTTSGIASGTFPLPPLQSFFHHPFLFLLALHFLGFAEVWDYDLEWDRLPDLSQGYTRIAAIVPSHRSHCLGIDEWICICLAPELNFSLFLSRFASPPLSRSVFSRRSSMSAPRIILPFEFGCRNAEDYTYCQPDVQKLVLQLKL